MVDVNDGTPFINFRKLIICRCQKEFERDYLQGLNRNKFEADLKEAGDDEAKKKAIQVAEVLAQAYPSR